MYVWSVGIISLCHLFCNDQKCVPTKVFKIDMCRFWTVHNTIPRYTEPIRFCVAQFEIEFFILESFVRNMWERNKNQQHTPITISLYVCVYVCFHVCSVLFFSTSFYLDVVVVVLFFFRRIIKNCSAIDYTAQTTYGRINSQSTTPNRQQHEITQQSNYCK